MINKTWEYYAKFVTHPQDKYTAFSVGVKDKENPGKWKNYNVFVLSKVYLKDGDKVKFTDIISCDQVEYKGKSQFKITAEVEVVGGNNNETRGIDDANNNQPINISGDELPF